MNLGKFFFSFFNRFTKNHNLTNGCIFLSQYDLNVYKLKFKFMSSLANNYNRRNISFKYGKGSFLYSTSGKKYLDFVQGIAVNSLGHAHHTTS